MHSFQILEVESFGNRPQKDFFLNPEMLHICTQLGLLTPDWEILGDLGAELGDDGIWEVMGTQQGCDVTESTPS